MKDRLGFGGLILVQLSSGLFLLWDILSSVLGLSVAPVSWALYELALIGAVFSLLVGALISARILSRSLKRQRAAEDGLRRASGAFMDVLQERFCTWALTPAERDVALFSIKGLSTAEIAGLRHTSEGTVKAQTNAIYRKAGVSGRPQLLSLFIDDLVDDTLIEQDETLLVAKAS